MFCITWWKCIPINSAVEKQKQKVFVSPTESVRSRLNLVSNDKIVEY